MFICIAHPLTLTFSPTRARLGVLRVDTAVPFRELTFDFEVRDINNLTTTRTLTIRIQDTTPPVVSLMGSSHVSVEGQAGSGYGSDPGAVAQDNLDTPLGFGVNATLLALQEEFAAAAAAAGGVTTIHPLPNVTRPWQLPTTAADVGRQYRLVFRACDRAGNCARVVRRVSVVSSASTTIANAVNMPAGTTAPVTLPPRHSTTHAASTTSSLLGDDGDGTSASGLSSSVLIVVALSGSAGGFAISMVLFVLLRRSLARSAVQHGNDQREEWAANFDDKHHIDNPAFVDHEREESQDHSSRHQKRVSSTSALSFSDLASKRASSFLPGLQMQSSRIGSDGNEGHTPRQLSLDNQYAGGPSRPPRTSDANNSPGYLQPRSAHPALAGNSNSNSNSNSDNSSGGGVQRRHILSLSGLPGSRGASSAAGVCAEVTDDGYDEIGEPAYASLDEDHMQYQRVGVEDAGGSYENADDLVPWAVDSDRESCEVDHSMSGDEETGGEREQESYDTLVLNDAYEDGYREVLPAKSDDDDSDSIEGFSQQQRAYDAGGVTAEEEQQQETEEEEAADEQDEGKEAADEQDEGREAADDEADRTDEPETHA